MKTVTYDAVVIGAGPGGYVCAIKLAQLGKKVLCIDRGKSWGGVCLNMGCIPSKALIHAATVYEEMTHGADLGITASDVRIDWSKTVAWKNSVVKKLTGGIGMLFKGHKVDGMTGEARLVGPNALEVTTEGDTVRVEAAAIVIATGASPVQIPGFTFDGERIHNAWSALDMTEIPKRFVIIGGGVIGLELGTVYAKLGSQVTVVEATAGLLPGTDADLTRVVERAMKRRKVAFHLETFAKEVTWEGGVGKVRVENKAGASTVLEADKVLVAVGMRPNTRGIGLEEVGVTLDARGFVATDDQFRTNVAGVYAIGDVSGPPLLAHKGSKEAELCAEIIAGHDRSKRDVQAMPGAVYTDPEIATVGLTEAQARAAEKDFVIGQFPFSALGRALTTGSGEGFVKVIAERSTRRLLGVGIVGPHASDLIAEATLAIEMGASAEDLSLTVHAHPTLAEGLMEAAFDAFGESVHVPPKARPAAAAAKHV